MSAAKSSSRITGSSGTRACRMNARHDALPRIWLVSLMAVRNDSDSSTIAAASTAMGTHCQLVISSGCWILCHPSYNANSPPTLKSTIDTRNA